MAGDGDEFCDDPFDDDDDDGDDDGESEGEGDPCDDGDEEEEEDEASCDDRDEDEDEDEASCDDGDEDEDEDEELCDVEEDGEDKELRDDEEDGEGQSEDLRHEPSGDDDESEGEELCGIPCNRDGGGGRGGEGSCVSGSSIRDGSESYLSDSLEDRPSSEEEDEAPGLDRGGERRLLSTGLGRWPPPVTGAFRMVVGFDDTDSDDYSDYSDDDSTYSDVGDVEFPSLPASRAAVAGLTEETLSEEEASWGCPVCKDVFASGQRVVWLPCKHYFHGDCIRPWLAIRSTCPVCRYQLPTDDAESGQRQARELTVLVPVAHQGAPPQSGDRGRGEGNSGRTTTGAGDATGCSTDGGPEQGAS